MNLYSEYLNLNRKSVLVYFFQFLGQFGSQIFGFLLSILIFRVSGVEITGLYYSLYAILNINFGVVGSGIKTNFYRNGNPNDISISLKSIIFSFIFLSLIFSPLYIFIFDFDIILYVILSANVLSFSLSGTLISYFRLKGKDFYGALINLSAPVLSLTLIAYFNPKTIIELSVLILTSWILVQFLTLFFVIKDFTYIFNFRKVIEYSFKSFILVLTTLITSIYGNSDIFFISLIDSEAAAGFYKVAISLTLIVIPSFSIFSFVYLSKIKPIVFKADWELFIALFIKQYRISLLLGVMFFIFGIVFNKYLIFLIYALESDEVYYSSIILSASVLFNLLSMLQSYTLLAFGLERKILKLLIFVVFFNVSLNYFLISQFSIIGASFTSLLTQILIYSLLSIKLKKQLRKSGLSISFCNPLGL